MPVLHGDRLVGKLDAATDLAAGVLRVHGVHWDVEPSRAMTDAVHREVRALAARLEVDLVGSDRDRPPDVGGNRRAGVRSSPTFAAGSAMR